jgi:hypothetical protein
MEVAEMSLSAWEKQALGSIADRLARSDPRLASLLATFTRLTSGEQMPARKKIQVIRRRAAYRTHRNRSPQWGKVPRQACSAGRRLGQQRAALLLCFLIFAGLIAVAVVFSSTGGDQCAQPMLIPCAEHAPAPAARPGAGMAANHWPATRPWRPNR